MSNKDSWWRGLATKIQGMNPKNPILKWLTTMIPRMMVSVYYLATTSLILGVISFIFATIIGEDNSAWDTFFYWGLAFFWPLYIGAIILIPYILIGLPIKYLTKKK